MNGSKAADRLDELLGRFVDSGYAPQGAELEGVDAGAVASGHHHGDGEAGVREVRYRGHEIKVATRYEVTIDGEPWPGSMQVMANGSVVSHDLPQYVVPSALDLVRAVIDQSYEAPEEIRSAIEAGHDGGEG